jgi:hypothetical protein
MDEVGRAHPHQQQLLDRAQEFFAEVEDLYV